MCEERAAVVKQNLICCCPRFLQIEAEKTVYLDTRWSILVVIAFRQLVAVGVDVTDKCFEKPPAGGRGLDELHDGVGLHVLEEARPMPDDDAVGRLGGAEASRKVDDDAEREVQHRVVEAHCDLREIKFNNFVNFLIRQASVYLFLGASLTFYHLD
jgi:hypothetical protein